MPQIVLYQTDIAQNVGSILRMAVCFGVPVHLIEPMGFVWDDSKFKRSGMDYIDRANITRHNSWQHFMDNKGEGRLVALTTKGSTPLPNFTFADDDYLLFGRESAGLPDSVHQQCDERVIIPMQKGERSLNIAQSCAIVTYQSLYA